MLGCFSNATTMLKPYVMMIIMLLGQDNIKTNYSYFSKEKVSVGVRYVSIHSPMLALSQEFVVIASAVITQKVALFQVFFKFKKYSEFRTAISLMNGLALGGIDHLLWKPPKKLFSV